MKNKGMLPAIIMFAVALITIIAAVVLYYAQEEKFGIYITDVIGVVCIVIVAIFMLFVKLKSWGWMFAVAFGLAMVAIPIYKQDRLQMASGIIVLAVGIIMIVLRNFKKVSSK